MFVFADKTLALVATHSFLLVSSMMIYGRSDLTMTFSYVYAAVVICSQFKIVEVFRLAVWKRIHQAKPCFLLCCLQLAYGIRLSEF